jgi:predicted enzyme related to lactoylglutathione lyase
MPRVTSHKPNRPIWLDLATTDAAAARAFYTRVLGWEYDLTGPEFGHYATARIGEAATAGLADKMDGDHSPPAWTTYFGTTDCDATAAQVVAKGGQVHFAPTDIGPFGRMAICADPTGAVFGLWQPKAHVGVGLINEPGAMAWNEVNTRDAAAAARFYADVFGLRAEVMEVAGAAYHMLHTAEGPACGVLQMTAEWGDMPPHWMSYFAVADVDAAKQAVLAGGGTVPFGPFDSPYGRIIVVQDPQGAACSLIQLAAG